MQRRTSAGQRRPGRCTRWLRPLAVAVALRAAPGAGLIAHLSATRAAAAEAYHTKPLLLPVQVPSLLQDPQNVPKTDVRYFVFEAGGVLAVDLLVERRAVPAAGAAAEAAAAAAAAAAGALATPPSPAPRTLAKSALCGLRRIAAAFSLPAPGPANAVEIPATLAEYVAAGGQVAAGGSAAGDQGTAGGGRAAGDGGGAGGGGGGSFAGGASAAGAGADARKRGLELAAQTFAAAGSPASSTPFPLRELHDASPRLDAVPTADEASPAAAPAAYLFLLTEAQWESFVVAANAVLLSLDGRALHAASAIRFPSAIRAELRVPCVSGQRLKFERRVERAGSYLLLLMFGEGSGGARVSGRLELRNPAPLLQLSAANGGTPAAARLLLALNGAAATVMAGARGVLGGGASLPTLYDFLTVNFALKAVYIGLDLWNMSTFRCAGFLSPLRWVLPRLVAKVQDIGVLLLYLLIAAGWQISRPQLSTVEVRALAAVSLLSLYLGIFEVSMGAFEAVRYVIHSLAYLVIIVSVNFEIVYLAGAIAEMGLAKSTAHAYQRWRGFKIFRVAFMLFVLKPTAVLLFKLTVLGEEGPVADDWVVAVLDNLVDFGIAVSVAYAFRPPRNFALFDALGIQDDDQGERPALAEASTPATN